MLKLPAEWRQVTSGAAVRHLMCQASDVPRQTRVARFLIAASLDLLKQMYAKRGGHLAQIAAVSELGWRVGDCCFIYVPAVNDDTLYEWSTGVQGLDAAVNLIVPPRYDRLLQLALQALLGKSAPTVMGLDSYVELRTLLTAGDFRWSLDRTKAELFAAYNRCALASGSDPSILIALPEECEHAPGG
jgi:hypothetical protein